MANFNINEISRTVKIDYLINSFLPLDSIHVEELKSLFSIKFLNLILDQRFSCCIPHHYIMSFT